MPESEIPDAGEMVREMLPWWLGAVLYDAACEVDDEVDDTEEERSSDGCFAGATGGA